MIDKIVKGNKYKVIDNLNSDLFKTGNIVIALESSTSESESLFFNGRLLLVYI